MERRPLILYSGVIRELPQGDTVAGASVIGGSGGATREPLTAMSSGAPDTVYSISGEMVSTDVT